MYRYALLDPRPASETEEINSSLLGPKTLGIEVTVPALAARCGLGNIDPQHSGTYAMQAAIEACLEAPLPPRGSVLATIRPDLDAIGSMAILSLRAQRVELSADCLARVDLVAKSDTFANGPWPGRQEIPAVTTLGERPILFTGEELQVAAISAAVADPRLTLETRVLWTERWLRFGEEPADYRQAWEKERHALAERLGAGSPCIRTLAEDRVATIISTHRLAVRIAYCAAPVVIALNPEFRFQGGAPHRKLTICQWAPGYVDLQTVKIELNRREMGWGGSATIIGSPQAVASSLSMSTVESIVLDSLQSSIV